MILCGGFLRADVGAQGTGSAVFLRFSRLFPPPIQTGGDIKTQNPRSRISFRVMKRVCEFSAIASTRVARPDTTALQELLN
jgi:hypothetical protein